MTGSRWHGRVCLEKGLSSVHSVGVHMTKYIIICQAMQHSLLSCSNWSLVPSRMLKLSWCLRHIGPFATLRLIWSRIASFSRTKRSRGIVGKQTKSTSICQEKLNLKIGELVEVKSEQEILATLDANEKNRGLLWMRDEKPLWQKVQSIQESRNDTTREQWRT